MFKQKTAFADEYAFIFQTVITSFGAKEIHDFQNKPSFPTYKRLLRGTSITKFTTRWTNNTLIDLLLFSERGFNTSII